MQVSRTTIRKNIEHAPFQIGQAVKVIGVADETGYPKLIGQTGTVIGLDYADKSPEHKNTYAGGVGQSYPDDPFIAVQIGDDITYFWREELKGESNETN